MATSGVSRRDLWHELMQLYIHEAWLLDDRKFHDWLDLFTDDVFYFMPRRRNVHRKNLAQELTEVGDLAIFEDDKTYLRMRVERLETGMAWAEDPPSRTRHLVGNLVVEPLPNGEVGAKTAFILYRSHHETEENIFAGSREDVLRKVEGQWKIARRVIVLDANVILAKNLSIFF
ncbi:MAG: 3-phenylpropionate/cinnamic acid dioxygenase subunit beta [Candidatus Tectomicrobia bacterium]|nr:3-phenylpropionate/cinnamic acid dioxygenase subunit beta [Candidatus Tectomicrobia bacterium]